MSVWIKEASVEVKACYHVKNISHVEGKPTWAVVNNETGECEQTFGSNKLMADNYAEELRAEKAKKEASMEVKAEELPVKPTDIPPEGQQYVYDPKSKTWILSIKATILSEFRDRLFPNPPAEITVGSKVYVKATKWSGTVVRTTEDGIYRVDVGDGVIAPLFRQEIEPLA